MVKKDIDELRANGLVSIKEALALPDAELASLIDRLLTALESGEDDEVDLAWTAEIERRGVELK